jgi:hypothetical protein
VRFPTSDFLLESISPSNFHESWHCGKFEPMQRLTVPILWIACRIVVQYSRKCRRSRLTLKGQQRKIFLLGFFPILYVGLDVEAKRISIFFHIFEVILILHGFPSILQRRFCRLLIFNIFCEKHCSLKPLFSLRCSLWKQGKICNAYSNFELWMLAV